MAVISRLLVVAFVSCVSVRVVECESMSCTSDTAAADIRGGGTTGPGIRSFGVQA